MCPAENNGPAVIPSSRPLWPRSDSVHGRDLAPKDKFHAAAVVRRYNPPCDWCRDQVCVTVGGWLGDRGTCARRGRGVLIFIPIGMGRDGGAV